MGLGATACTEKAAPTSPNLLVIAVDTLRADHLGGYGYGRSTSPNIDKFLGQSVVFDDAHSTSSWTLPSFASLFTSLHSSSHKCWQYDSQLDASAVTLAETLKSAGYETSAVVSHVFLGRKYGLAQGFDDYDESLVYELKESHSAVSSPEVTSKVVEFLEEQAAGEDGQPWFHFAHYFDPHHHYNNHDEFDFGEEETIDLYDSEIAFTDRYIGEVLDKLDELGLAENTVVAFVADHGEQFYEHSRRWHGRTLFTEVERIPFAIRAPGFDARRVSQAVSGVDFRPTLLELLDVGGADFPQAGESLVELMHGNDAPIFDERAVLLELRLDFRQDANLESLIKGPWKLIVEKPKAINGRVLKKTKPTIMLFNRIEDPLEQNDVAAANPEITKQLRIALKAAVREAEELGDKLSAAGDLDLSAEEVENLRGLGYVGDE